MADDSVLLRTEGHAGYITLNRPKALNALTHAMVDRIADALDAWEADPAVRTVVIAGAGERGLCAGGDIRAIHDDARALRDGSHATGGDARAAGDGDRAARDEVQAVRDSARAARDSARATRDDARAAREGTRATRADDRPGTGSASAAFWRTEYRLNARIARYPKPYVALMDGIVMGGGIGISAHGGVRIVTERSRLAMPETGIGFVPDVGGTYLLALAPGGLGTHLALTATAVGAADALLCGLADHHVPAARLPEFAAALARGTVHDVLPGFVAPPPEGELAAHREWIDACYAAPTVEEILDRLRACGHPAAKEAAEAILAKSPTALKVTLAALRRAPALGPLERVLEQEYRVSCAALATPDLVEGIRAQVVDKDRNPRWTPATLADVSAEDVERFFAPLGDRELTLAPGDGPLQEVPW
ncbi:enoyl-CoA hydratase/isomerase family protein [Streptomyces mobaraensis NBRC 13819 = DSM 40847]|uniref:3-hydroxyisobutyryl-CoA hydrolase n=1 Tax=Streptomyces mobaraensis (strain ATCC 29032 / DSM 40847 / JCM 4168 / NBRC 13819 / NCIMB 11159 / IPCR 16-22) TaxID=1223523 RepID=M3BR21_STRM1|nr:enoyl-CoA hydratase/isomerase family protein [Streptomyces mobaraensis]EMF02160.1 enoyl-CoA hydratase [Streptomyces mobaraensis NBRC 13819 = DSM 40847]QTT76661.1 enoyl-CoA hydratase/isomerase family protein [Streptomyces mobaraensis NBRC 13819 = DSM 40847]